MYINIHNFSLVNLFLLVNVNHKIVDWFRRSSRVALFRRSRVRLYVRRFFLHLLILFDGEGYTLPQQRLLL
jgi:hypothetical protein